MLFCKEISFRLINKRDSRIIDTSYEFITVSKRVQVRNHSCENDFDLHENEIACKTHFHMKGFALGLGRFETEAKENSEMA